MINAKSLILRRSLNLAKAMLGALAMAVALG